MFQFLIRKMKTRLYRQKMLDEHSHSTSQYKLVKTTSQLAIKMLIDQLKIGNHFIITSSPFCSLYIKSVAIQPSKYWEVHGSLNFFQCEHGLVYHNFGDSPNFKFDRNTMEAHWIPQCRCQKPGIVRPNILMYNDESFDTQRSDHQQKNFKQFIGNMAR